jgi:hypothetical protein
MSPVGSLSVCSEISVALCRSRGMGAVSSFDSVLPPTTVSSGTKDGTSSHPASTMEGRMEGRRGGRAMLRASVAPDLVAS